MQTNKLSRLIIVITAGMLMFAGIQPAAADELDDLKKQVEALARRIEQLERERAEAQAQVPPANNATVTTSAAPAPLPQPATPPSQQKDGTIPQEGQAITAGDMEGSFKIPDTNTSFRIHGFAQANLIYDFAGRPTSRNGDSAGIHTSVLEDTPEYHMTGDTRIGARDSRLGISTFTPTPIGGLSTLIEGDFNTSPAGKSTRATTSRASFSVRHAYGEIGNFLAGQTFTTYMDLSAFTEKLDGAGPLGRTFIRQGMLRYTHKFDKNSRFAIALENPRGDFVNANDDTLDDSVPDVAMNYRYQTRRGHMQFSAILRRLGVDDGGPDGTFGGIDDNAFGWGLQHSAAIYLGETKDRISWYINFGDGLGRYADSGVDQAASITREGTLDTQFSYGGFISYRHWWTDTIRSNIDLAMMRHDLNPLEEAMFPDEERDANRRLFSSHANTLWSPVEQITLGLEYIWGNRTVHDGRDGKVRRLQFTTIYDF
jgi:hypothetical protein